MCGVRKLTHTAYANQRMTLDRKSAKFQDKAEYDDRATWAIHVACSHHSCFMTGVCRCLYQTWMFENTPLFFYVRECGVKQVRREKNTCKIFKKTYEKQ